MPTTSGFDLPGYQVAGHSWMGTDLIWFHLHLHLTTILHPIVQSVHILERKLEEVGNA